MPVVLSHWAAQSDRSRPDAFSRAAIRGPWLYFVRYVLLTNLQPRDTYPRAQARPLVAGEAAGSDTADGTDSADAADPEASADE